MLTASPGISVIREATGFNSAAIQGTVDAFRADLGINNGVQVGSQADGRREVNWDGVPDAGASPASLPGNFFNSNSVRGLLLEASAGTTFQVSADADNASNTGIEFENIKASYSTALNSFSPERIFAVLGGNEFEVRFVVPGTDEPATVSAFGAVFTDVDLAGRTKLEFFDSVGTLIGSRFVMASNGSGSLSFLGVKFQGNPIARVRITAGEAGLKFDDLTQGGDDDIVAMDDFIYSEPQALPVARVVVGSGLKSDPTIRVLDGTNGDVLGTILPFEQSYRGGVRVATGDVNGDGVLDIIAGSGPKSPAQVRVFDGVTLQQIGVINPFDARFKGGVTVAAGDFDGDGRSDIIVGQGAGKKRDGATTIKVYSGNGLGELHTLTPYGAEYRGGVTVAGGDADQDGLDDILVGANASPFAPRVFLTDNLAQPFFGLNPFANQPGFRGGVTVAMGDVNGDGQQDYIFGADGTGSNSLVQVINGQNFQLLFEALDVAAAQGSVRVGVLDMNRDGRLDILTSFGPKSAPIVKALGVGHGDLDSLFVFDTAFRGGVFVAGS